MTPIEQIEQLTSANAALTESATLTATKISELQAALDTANIEAVKVADLSASVADLTAKLEAATKERDEAKADAQKKADAMALKPSAFDDISNGAKPAKDGAQASEKSLTEQLRELTASGDATAARAFYKQHKTEFKRLGASIPKN